RAADGEEIGARAPQDRDPSAPQELAARVVRSHEMHRHEPFLEEPQLVRLGDLRSGLRVRALGEVNAEGCVPRSTVARPAGRQLRLEAHRVDNSDTSDTQGEAVREFRLPRIVMYGRRDPGDEVLQRPEE